MLVTSEDFGSIDRSIHHHHHHYHHHDSTKLSYLNKIENEQTGNNFGNEINSFNSNQSQILDSISPVTSPIKRGLLWHQKDGLFSRWKERYFILTKDYLNCFKRASGPASERISEMGQFLFKIKLVDVEKVEWTKRKSYIVIGLVVAKEGRIFLRCDNFLEEWFEMIQTFTVVSKKRKEVLKIAQIPRTRASFAAPLSQELNPSNMARSSFACAVRNFSNRRTENSSKAYNLFDSVPDLSNLRHVYETQTIYSTLNKTPYSDNLTSNCSNDSQKSSFSSEFFEIPERLNSNHDDADDEEDVEVVELRKKQHEYQNGTNYENWMYQKPRSPVRHSIPIYFNQTTNDIDKNDITSKNSINTSTNSSMISCNWTNKPHNSLNKVRSVEGLQQKRCRIPE